MTILGFSMVFGLLISIFTGLGQSLWVVPIVVLLLFFSTLMELMQNIWIINRILTRKNNPMMEQHGFVNKNRTLYGRVNGYKIQLSPLLSDRGHIALVLKIELPEEKEIRNTRQLWELFDKQSMKISKNSVVFQNWRHSVVSYYTPKRIWKGIFSVVSKLSRL